MAGVMQNLFVNVPTDLTEELVEVLEQNEHVRIERIVSNGQSSPAGFWYDQAEIEWVIVLKGEASLRIEREVDPRHLKAGDHLKIPPHQRHRVEWTTPDQPTVWLAVFF